MIPRTQFQHRTQPIENDEDGLEVQVVSTYDREGFTASKATKCFLADAEAIKRQHERELIAEALARQ